MYLQVPEFMQTQEGRIKTLEADLRVRRLEDEVCIFLTLMNFIRSVLVLCLLPN